MLNSKDIITEEHAADVRLGGDGDQHILLRAGHTEATTLDAVVAVDRGAVHRLSRHARTHDIMSKQM